MISIICVVIIILMIHTQNYAFLTLSETNIKVFNLMSRTNETSHTEWHKTRKCKCRLDASVCNDKQRWNNDNADVNVKS